MENIESYKIDLWVPAVCNFCLDNRRKQPDLRLIIGPHPSNPAGCRTRNPIRKMRTYQKTRQTTSSFGFIPAKNAIPPARSGTPAQTSKYIACPLYFNRIKEQLPEPCSYAGMRKAKYKQALKDIIAKCTVFTITMRYFNTEDRNSKSRLGETPDRLNRAAQSS